MSAVETAKPAKAKPGKLLFVVLAFVAGAAAGGFGAAIGTGMAGGMVGGMAGGLVSGGGNGHAPQGPAAAAPVEYVEIDNAFTSNLVDTGRYLQVRISVSTTGGPEVVAAIARHKPALISAVLAVMGEAGEADVANRGAKDKLRAKLLAAINSVLRARGAAPGIDEVYFTSLVVQ